MTTYPTDWVDAFTDRPFGGNGCAVVYDEGQLDDATCLAFTRETGLVECTFVGPSDVADVKVRYFLASREIPFAGHPTIATVASLLHRGRGTGDAMTLETGAGVIPITVEDGLIGMTQVAPSFGPDLPAEDVAAIYGLAASDIVAPPQLVSTGLPFWVTLLRDADALRRATLDVPALLAFRAAQGVESEAYLITLEGQDGGDTFARLLLPPPNPPEDPFTGSATGAAAAYLWARGLLPSASYTAEQGHWLGRPGRAEVEVLGPRDAITGVRVAGRAHVLMSGELRL